MGIISKAINRIMEPELVLAGIVNLTEKELLYLNRIGTSEKPAGIIRNSSNEVLIRNRASLAQLKGWGGVKIFNTASLWQKSVLSELVNDIYRIEEGEGFRREYQLSVPKVGLVFLRVKFTRITFRGNVSRVFEQIDCRIVGEV